MRISESTKELIEKYGGPFESPDDVVKKVFKAFEILAKNENKNPRTLLVKLEEEERDHLLTGEGNKEPDIPENKKYREIIERIENIDSNIILEPKKYMVSSYHPKKKKGNGLAWFRHPQNDKTRVLLRKLEYPAKVDPENRIVYEKELGGYPYIDISLDDEDDIQYLIDIIEFAL